MRLSLKLFVALAVVAGPIVALSPSAAAHRNTGSVAAVTGTVNWDCGTGKAGLPIGNPETQSLYTTPECDFTFGTIGINSAGLWDGMNQKTSFDCESSGQTGPSGNDKTVPSPTLPIPTTDPNQSVALSTTFGAFKGTFACDGLGLTGNPLIDDLFYNLPGSRGNFRGLTAAGTTIGFLGEVFCTAGKTGAENGGTCPLSETPGPGQKNYTQPANGGQVNPAGALPTGWGVGANHNLPTTFRHTIACKGEVVPVPGIGYFGTADEFADGADVALECVIA